MWYNLIMAKQLNYQEYCTPYQMKLPLEISKIIEISDPVYSFSEIVDHIDLSKYFAEKGCRIGRPRCDSIKLLKIILFAFMEGGYETLRQLEKMCKTDIRYMWILDGMKAPSFMTFCNFINEELTEKIEDIFQEINRYIFDKEEVDLTHVYIDGTKIEANANRYSWVWKKSCMTNIPKIFEKVSKLLEKINKEIFVYYGVKAEIREEYAIEYIEDILQKYEKITGICKDEFVSGKGHHKSNLQRYYQELDEYLCRLKEYSKRIEICGEKRNSYSKTDKDATFMRVKKDYMGNDQLVPAYNMQAGICDEYIAVISAEQYASDMDCFIPLMEKFKKLYGSYPKYPVADAGYGSYNNYLYCEEHGMEKYMKFTMFEKEIKDSQYHNDPFRASNFRKNENGELVCPNNKRFLHYQDKPIRGNKYGRTEEILMCEDCSNCPYQAKCRKSKDCNRNRTIRVNAELTQIYSEVINNLESIHGALLRTNRSIQSEGTFGVIKWDRTYKRTFRRGIESVILEFTLISIGFNLYKYHNKKQRMDIAA